MHSSLTPSEIINMTYIQFKNAVEHLGIKFNWQIQLAVCSVAPEVLDEGTPLKCIMQTRQQEKLTMEDAMALLNGCS